MDPVDRLEHQAVEPRRVFGDGIGDAVDCRLGRCKGGPIAQPGVGGVVDALPRRFDAAQPIPRRHDARADVRRVGRIGKHARHGQRAPRVHRDCLADSFAHRSEIALGCRFGEQDRARVFQPRSACEQVGADHVCPAFVGEPDLGRFLEPSPVGLDERRPEARRLEHPNGVRDCRHVGDQRRCDSRSAHRRYLVVKDRRHAHELIRAYVVRVVAPLPGQVTADQQRTRQPKRQPRRRKQGEPRTAAKAAKDDRKHTNGEKRREGAAKRVPRSFAGRSTVLRQSRVRLRTALYEGGRSAPGFLRDPVVVEAVGVGLLFSKRPIAQPSPFHWLDISSYR